MAMTAMIPEKDDTQMSEQPELDNQQDELIVDLQHLPVVRDYLATLGVQYAGPPEEEDRLGLARFQELRDNWGDAVDLDALAAVIRNHFAGRYDGWTPILGKNRYLSAVIGSGHKPMANGEPVDEPVSAVPAPDPPAAADAGTGVRVGMIDTPFWQSADHDPALEVPFYAGHSRFVRSLIRQQAPGAEILLGGHQHRPGTLDPATGRASSWDTAIDIVRLANDGIDLLNLSLGGYAPGYPPLVISRAIQLITPGVLVVAAAGNHGEFFTWEKGRTKDSAIWPGAIPPVISVGAHDQYGHRASFSPNLPWVRCSAAGVEVIGEYLDSDKVGGFAQAPDPQVFHGFARWSGTSFATATVSGAIAAATVPGQVSPAEAFTKVLRAGNVVKEFVVGP
jgi:membrane-anchored mycosin MYCP